MGRARKPTALKLLHGDFDKDPQRRNHSEPEPEAGIPKCPAYMKGDARKEWKMITTELQSMGVVTLVDRAALEMYCESRATMHDCRRMIQKEGLMIGTPSGDTKEHPAGKVLRDNNRICQSILVQFGMTPSSRTRLHVSKESKVDEAEARFFGT